MILCRPVSLVRDAEYKHTVSSAHTGLLFWVDSSLVSPASFFVPSSQIQHLENMAGYNGSKSYKTSETE